MKSRNDRSHEVRRKTVLEHANVLQTLWQELDYYWVFCNFLAGLNNKFDQVRVRIIKKEETSFLEETIFLILAEDHKRSFMLDKRPSFRYISLFSRER